MSKIISLFAGPGTGKSTCASYIYAHLKAKGINAELVREYIKGWAWEGRFPGIYDQIYLLGKQIRRETVLLGKADVLITDAPPGICGFYTEKYSPPAIKRAIHTTLRSYREQSEIDGHEHVDIWLKRIHAYDPGGRYETEEEALEVSVEMKKLLIREGYDLMEINPDFSSLDRLIAFLGY